jgi:FixJ family two-component response regulator
MKLGAVDFLDLPFTELLLVASLNSVIIQKESDLEQTIFASSVASRLTRLTIRERNVLEHVLLGSRNKIIAYKLGISQRTVENHRSRVMNKMGANSIADLINIINSASKKDQ